MSLHLQLYTDTCLACSKVITRKYSTSFSLGIQTLHKRFHQPIYGIYGFVRYADEIVDTFHEYDKEALLTQFRDDTWRAIESHISINPVLHAFQAVVHQYQIERELIEAFLHSMEMDLHQNRYSDASYAEYIYGSAEVVGLMCLRVFCEGDDALYQRLREPARSLGSAFQKVNFLRDIKSDYQERGRVYFPGVDFERFSEAAKREIEEDIRRDFKHAYEGIVNLPEGAREGVELAYRYYVRLFDKIRRLPSARILKERIRVPDNQKLAIWFGLFLRRQMSF
jgi:phytoene/squalene synthetase